MAYDSSMLTPTLLDRYAAGECPPDEAVAVREWLSADPSHVALFERIQTLRAEVARYPRGDVGAMWERMVPEIYGTVTQPVVSTHKAPAIAASAIAHAQQKIPWAGRTNVPVRPWRAVAAVGALFAFIGIVVLGKKNVFSEPGSVAKTYRTSVGQRAVVTLSGGARITLGPATTLSVTTQPADGSTVIRMTGEALFSVANRSERPFVVHAGNTVARVLGTTFVVRRYDTDQETRVVVAAGRVTVHDVRITAAPTTILSAKHLAVVDDSGNVRVAPVSASEDYTAWTKGELVFHNTHVRDIVAELSRAYGASIRLSDSAFASRALTWRVPVNDKSLTDALELLTLMLDAHVVRSGSVLTITPGAAAPRKSAIPQVPHTTESQYGR